MRIAPWVRFVLSADLRPGGVRLVERVRFVVRFAAWSGAIPSDSTARFLVALEFAVSGELYCATKRDQGRRNLWGRR